MGSRVLAVVVLATAAWVIVPLGMLFQTGGDTSSDLPLYLWMCSLILAATAMYVGYTLRGNPIRMARIGSDLAKVYLQVNGLLVAISALLSYTGK